MDWTKSIATQPYRTTTAAQRIGRLVSVAERNETIMAGLTYTLIESNPFTRTEHAVAEHLALSDACRLRDLLEDLRPLDSDVRYHLRADTGFPSRPVHVFLGGPVVGPDPRD